MNKTRKQSDATYPIFFFMVDSTDHITGKTGLSPTVTISKNGGSFSSPSGAVSEVGNGLYKIAGNATDSNTLGDIWIHATGTGADTTDTSYTIVPFDPFDSVRMGLTSLPNAAAEAAGGLYTRGSGAGQINQPANGQIDANAVKVSGTTQTARDLGASVLLSSGTGTGQISLSSGAVLLQATQTGVTIPTVTNLTNAPTNGDLTATMKASVTTAATAATPIAASVSGAVGSIATNGITATSIATDAINAASIKADAVTKIQNGLATPTNITAGTITTVTNLTNAPTSGDLTATMKASVTTSATSATPTIGGISSAALADMFDTNSGTTYASAVAGSVVKEIADNAGGSALTAGAIADAVWDESISGHLGAGSTGNALNAAGSAGDPWSTPLPGSYGSGTAGKIIGDNINAPIATVDTVVDAIKVKTDFLPSATAGASGGLFIAGTNAATSVTTALTANITGNLSGSVGSVTGNVGGSVGSVTGNVAGSVGSVTGNVGGNVAGSVGSVTAAVSTTSNIKQNQALANFEFMMTDSTNHAPATGKTVTCTRSIDGGAFSSGSLSNINEISNGMYRVDFSASDLNGKCIVLRATASASDDTFERIITVP